MPDADSLTLRQLRGLSGHTQQEAADYLECAKATIWRIEAGHPDAFKRRELYELKLRRDGIIKGEVR